MARTYREIAIEEMLQRAPPRVRADGNGAGTAVPPAFPSGQRDSATCSNFHRMTLSSQRGSRGSPQVGVSAKVVAAIDTQKERPRRFLCGGPSLRFRERRS